MIAAANAKKTTKTRRTRRPWAPSAQDHFIYELVKFEGLTQSQVADRQRLSQSTVSRILQRYERWQAHADPREGGRLDPAERLRAQRWLTYERNELILGSALRLARELEGRTELWRTVRTKSASPYRADRDQDRDETRAIDRSGLPARYLRLAFKVNMEQLELVEKDPPPLPEPLTAEELAEEERQDAAADAELAEQQRREEENLAEYYRQRAAGLTGITLGCEAATEIAGTTSGRGESPAEGQPAALREQVCSRLRESQEASAAPAATEAAAVLNLHKMHNGESENSSASVAASCTCAADAAIEKIAEDACIDVASTAPCERTPPADRRGSPDPAVELTVRSPSAADAGDLRSDDGAGSGDPRTTETEGPFGAAPPPVGSPEWKAAREAWKRARDQRVIEEAARRYELERAKEEEREERRRRSRERDNYAPPLDLGYQPAR
jgi:hypothetical protein